MADAKLSALTELAATPASDDEVYIRDISEAVADESKRITIANLVTAVIEAEDPLNLAGDVDVATGKTLSADGLKFPATQVASADGNTQDDYEEGSWTLTVADQTLDGTGEGQGYSVQVGRYTKIGDRVFFTGRVEVSDLGTLTSGDSIRVMGLPFTSLSTANSHTPVYVGWATGLAVTASENITGYIAPGTAHIDLSLWDATGGITPFLVSELSADGFLNVAGHYGV